MLRGKSKQSPAAEAEGSPIKDDATTLAAQAPVESNESDSDSAAHSSEQPNKKRKVGDKGTDTSISASSVSASGGPATPATPAVSPPGCEDCTRCGIFHQATDTMIVGDPCYTQPEIDKYGFSEQIPRCITGKWRCYIRPFVHENYGDGYVAELIALSLDAERTVPSLSTAGATFEQRVLQNDIEWRLLGKKGVDSGQMGMFDKRFFRRNKTVEGKQLDERVMNVLPPSPEAAKSHRYYAHCCFATDAEANGKGIPASSIPGGVVSRSGFGDGRYKIHVLSIKSKRLPATSVPAAAPAAASSSSDPAPEAKPFSFSMTTPPEEIVPLDETAIAVKIVFIDDAERKLFEEQLAASRRPR